MTLDLARIQQAAETIRGQVVSTACLHSRTLSEITQAEVWVKFENHQFTASFKDRGALVRLLKLTPEQKRNGVIAMSAGNHAQAIAYHCRNLGLESTIVMPRNTPNIKVKHTRNLGAQVILTGNDFDEARAYTEKYAVDHGMEMVHPYDDLDVMAGQGTIALEILHTVPDLEVLVVPVGGGGLISGTAIAAKALRPEIEITGVQTQRFPSMHQALRGKPIECGSNTLAEGIAVKEPGKLTLPVVRNLVSEILLVEEDQIERAVLLFLEVEKTVVEGAGAVGLSALLQYPERFQGRKVGLILSGGNIDLFALSSIMQRGLARSARLARLRVGLPDVPGALARVSQLLGEANANIIEVHHQRAFSNLSLKVAEVDFVLHTLGKEHLDQILNRLSEAGYRPKLL